MLLIQYDMKLLNTIYKKLERLSDENPFLFQCKQRGKRYLYYYLHCLFCLQTPFFQNRYAQIANKLKKQDHIKVAFVVHERAKWSAQSVFDAFARDSRFSPTIFISYSTYWGEKATTEQERNNFQKNCDFFQERGMKTERLFDIESGKSIPLTNFSQDIVFYQEPMSYRHVDFPAVVSRNSLVCYIPYGIMMAAIQQYQFDCDFHNMCWKIFCETPIHLDLAKKYAFNRGKNVVVTGYPKMDSFLRDETVSDIDLWKIPRHRAPDIKRIIWAPHWTIREIDASMKTASTVCFGTFRKYHEMFYEYLKNHPEIEIMLKPHPLLVMECVQMGIDYQGFIRRWCDLPNGSYYDGGDYIDLFRTSDAMILDSVSFIAEYMFTGKPMQFLCRTPDILKTDFNEFGVEAVKRLYEAHQWADVEHFIEDVVFLRKDPIQQSRKDFVKNVLRPSHQSAGEFVVNYIKEILS